MSSIIPIIITVNDSPTVSEEVIIVPDITTEIFKYIIDNGNLVETKTIDDENQEIVFYGEFTVSNREDLTSVVFKDELETPFTYVDGSIKVYDSNGNDVTDKGIVSVSGQIVTFTFNTDYLKNVGGKSFTVELTVTYNSNSDLSGYENRTIPNTMELIVNDEPTNSNTVTVIVNENVGTADFDDDPNNGLLNLLNVKTGDSNIQFLVIIIAAALLSVVLIIRVTKKAKNKR